MHSPVSCSDGNMGGWKALAVVGLAALLGSPVLTQRTPWMGPKGAEFARSAALKERLHQPVAGPEDALPRETPVGAASPLCLECQLAVIALQEEIAAGAGLDLLVTEGIAICQVTFGYTQTFCEGYVPMIMPILQYILVNDEVHPVDACGELLTHFGCTTDDPKREWTVEIQGEKPPVVGVTPPEPDAPRLKVLHLADSHMDPLYLPGSNAACPEELCCREESGVPENETAEAWYWGDYRHCGTPSWMMEDLLTHATTTHPDIDYVVWTGDLVPHNMWSTSREWNLRVVREMNDMVRAFFPTVPVFPVAGNHEMSPLDQYPEPGGVPEDLSADWLYGELVSQWSQMVPDLDNSTVTRGAYYSVLVRPGFRIISFNSMFGYSSNAWLIESSQDPASELAWLEAELGKAEAAGELVHLLGHVPPGLRAAERTWSREYNKLVVRYENIIRGQFFGHTHYDEFEVFHDGERPIGVAYIAPSQTPWYDLNPAYRIYYIDGDRTDSTRTVLDHETYIMNLTEAHETGAARWYQLYSARELYTMENLTPQDWQDLAERMAGDRDLFDLYFRNFVSGGDPYMAVGCDDLCYEQRLCDMVTSNRNDLDTCSAVLRLKRRS
ncbi:sphingomyelin phosphodiesterase-like [Eriocheir sinensis]|uniref:sphingomyelin phosphodiesterase-like n=1 Tax=Eriocheir sinensis TaxID=95602 RepID=UPI0021CA6FB3|nr:sphingomyelin phosphodiesterase-like [Eriocheir sinensis]